MDDIGDVVTSTNPGDSAPAWTRTGVGIDPFFEISCPSITLCVIASGTPSNPAGKVITSIDPTGPASAWTVTAVESYQQLSISCGSAQLCVAVDNVGNVLAGHRLPAPAVSAVLPSRGGTVGGTILTISGSAFNGATAVQVGGKQATDVVVIDPRTIQATSPPGPVGIADITVTTPAGTSQLSGADQFSYVVPSAGSYQAVQPTRICDTRPIQPGVVTNQCNDGNPRVASPLGSGETMSIDVCGGAGANCSLSAVALNVTVTATMGSSFLTVYPNGVARPVASNLDYTAGETVANLVEVKVGANGAIALYNNTSSADVIVDLEGTVVGGSSPGTSPGLYTPVSPQRRCDTRVDQAGVATNQCNNGGGGATLGSNGTLNVQVTGQGGIPSVGVSAVVLNVTATDTSTSSYLTAWPTDNPRPTASNVDWAAGQTVPNRVIVPVGHNGQISVFNASGSTDVVIDVNGWYGDGSGTTVGTTLTGITPTRICDSSVNQIGVASNQCNNGGGGNIVAAGPTMTVQVTSTGGVVPANAQAVVVNVTATDTTAASYLTVWPSDVAQPMISDLNWASGETVPNLVVVKLSASGQIAVFNHSGATDVIVDVVGYYT